MCIGEWVVLSRSLTYRKREATDCPIEGVLKRAVVRRIAGVVITSAAMGADYPGSRGLS